MNGIRTAPNHIEITETLIKLYDFLAQSLDHCLDQWERGTSEEHELQAHLSSSRAQMMDMLVGNPTVKQKVEPECKRVLSLTSACLSNGSQNSVAMKEATAERDTLRCKATALRDLLEVFHSA